LQAGEATGEVPYKNILNKNFSTTQLILMNKRLIDSALQPDDVENLKNVLSFTLRRFYVKKQPQQLFNRSTKLHKQ
jgi:hypothetical protein